MASGEVHVGDIGTAFRLRVRDEDGAVVNIAAATVRNILFKKPSGTTVRKDAVNTTDGSDGRMHYVTEAGDLDEPGTWRYQGYLEMDGGAWYTDITRIRIFDNL